LITRDISCIVGIYLRYNSSNTRNVKMKIGFAADQGSCIRKVSILKTLTKAVAFLKTQVSDGVINTH
jgi:hypothetical protein